jgi:hypothetical protein
MNSANNQEADWSACAAVKLCAKPSRLAAAPAAAAPTAEPTI